MELLRNIFTKPAVCEPQVEGLPVLGCPDGLMKAILQENPTLAAQVLATGVDVNQVYNINSVTCTPLAKAAETGQGEVVRLLLGARADANQVVTLDNWAGTQRVVMGRGKPPLLWALASSRGSLNVVESLLEGRADVSWRSDRGTTALMKAAEAGHAGAVQLILLARADIDEADDAGLTALSVAVRSRTGIAALTALLEARANVNTASVEGVGPLAYAARAGHVKALRALLEARANVNAMAAPESAALRLAVDHGHAEAAMLLLEARALVANALQPWAADDLPSVALRAAQGEPEASRALLERLAAAADPPQDPGWAQLEGVARLFAPVAREPLAAWARNAVACEQLRAAQPSRAELRARLDEDPSSRLDFLMVGSDPSRRGKRAWSGSLVGREGARLRAAWASSEGGPELVDEFLGDSLFVLDEARGLGTSAFDGTSYEAHLLRREGHGARWARCAEVFQQLLARRRGFRERLFSRPAAAALELEGAVLAELARRVWPARRIATSLSPLAACEGTPDCSAAGAGDDSPGAAALLCVVAALLEHGAVSDMEDEGDGEVPPLPEKWPTAPALRRLCRRVLQASGFSVEFSLEVFEAHEGVPAQARQAASEVAAEGERPGLLTKAFAACWSAAAPPGAGSDDGGAAAGGSPALQLDPGLRARRLGLLRALGARLREPGAGALAACTVDSLQALAADSPFPSAPVGSRVVFVDCTDDITARRGAITATPTQEVFKVQLEADSELGQAASPEFRVLGKSDFGRVWFVEDAFERAAWRRPEAALLRCVGFEQLGAEVMDALHEGNEELPIIAEHAEAMAFLRLRRLREAEHAQHALLGKDAAGDVLMEAEGDTGWEALQELAQQFLDQEAAAALLLAEAEGSGTAAEEAEATSPDAHLPHYGGSASSRVPLPPAFWAVLVPATPASAASPSPSPSPPWAAGAASRASPGSSASPVEAPAAEADPAADSPSSASPTSDGVFAPARRGPAMRPRLYPDAISGDQMLAELRHHASAASAPAPTQEAPAIGLRRSRLRSRLSSDGSPRKMLRSFSSMSSGVWSESGGAPSPLNMGVPLCPAKAVQDLAERMREMGLPVLPEGDLLAHLRLAHWSADQALLEVVGND